MIARLTALAAPLVLASFAFAADGDRKLTVETSPLFTAESVTVYQTEDGKRESVGELTKLDEAIALPGGGPFEVFVKPKGGVAVRVAEKLTVKAGETHELKIVELLGTVEVFGDNLPRAKRVVVTAVKDPGPGGKGHEAIQSAGAYRVGMAVPPGTYAVWVVPANGARAVRVEDNVRVQAGRSTKVGE